MYQGFHLNTFLSCKANLMLPRPMREFIWTDVMYNPNMEREKKGRHFKKASVFELKL